MQYGMRIPAQSLIIFSFKICYRKVNFIRKLFFVSLNKYNTRGSSHLVTTNYVHKLHKNLLKSDFYKGQNV